MILFVKYALLSILIRIFSPYKCRICFIYVLFGCLTIYYVIAEIVKIRMCNPIPAYWTLDAGANCLDQRAALIADSVISVVTDACFPRIGSMKVNEPILELLNFHVVLGRLFSLVEYSTLRLP
jgi:hypothetical protein